MVLRVPRRLRGPARGLRQHPGPDEARLLHRHAGAPAVGDPADVLSGEELGTGRARPTGHDPEEHQATPRRLPVGHLHADPDARARRRHHAQPHLLQLHHPARRHHRVGDQPPGPREHEVPARRHLPGLRARRGRGRGRLRARGVDRDRPALRTPALAAVPHRRQVPARARPDQRNAARHRGHRLRGRGLPDRPAGPARVRALECHRLPAVLGRRRSRQPLGLASGLVDRPRVQLLRLPGHHPRHDDAPHVHLAAEHVPQGSRPAQGRHEGDARSREHQPRELRRLHHRQLHLEAAPRHRRLHDVRALHLGVPCQRDGQAPRPSRDRPEDRRGHGPHR